METVKLNNGRCILLNGDCLHEMKRIKPNSIDMVFADLPYGTTACKWDSIIPFDPLWRLLKNIGKSNTPYIFTASGGFQYKLVNSQFDLYKYSWIWDKVKPSSGLTAKVSPLRVFEEIIIFSQGVPIYNPIMVPKKQRAEWKNDRNGEAFGNNRIVRYHDNHGVGYPKDILTISNANQVNRVHPTQKPVELLEYLIKTYTNPGDTVLDPTMGSGTTGVACINLNRRFIGIEKDENYFNIATNRINEAIKQLQKVAA